MLKKSILTYLLILYATQSLTCINVYRTKLDGSSYHSNSEFNKVHYTIPDTNLIRIESAELFSEYLLSNNIQHLSDYAAKLIYLGEYEKAKTIYQEIEQKSPDLYTTASNLGTLYELTGQPDSALVWIQKSIQLNPESHKGSEWIHLKILEYQISPFKDSTKSILGLDFGLNSIPINNTNKDLQELYKHIYHQLSERLQFVSPPNKIVGNIYNDLGNTFAITTNIESAIVCYEEAMRFGFASKLMLKRYLKFKYMTNSSNAYNNLYDFAKRNLLITLLLFLASIVLTPLILIKTFKWLFSKNQSK